MTHRVFVYGTLKRGGSNHPLLAGSGFLGKAVTLAAYKMVAASFPVIMPDPSGRPVAGEVYSVDDATLARLDQLEREGRSYDRVTIDAVLVQQLSDEHRNRPRAASVELAKGMLQPRRGHQTRKRCQERCQERVGTLSAA